MTLKQRVESELAKTTLDPTGAAILNVDHDGQRFACELVAIEPLALSFASFTLSTDSLAGATPEMLHAISERLAARLTYLLEPISPIEIDAEQSVVQMRSMPPQRDEHRTCYYELIVRRGGELSLCRYEAATGQERTAVPAHVTREVLLRLVDDFSQAAA